MLSGGAEYIYDDKFTIRGGVFYESKTKGGRQYGTLGIGLKYQTFTVNAAYLVPFASRHPLQNQMRFSLLFDLFPNFELFYNWNIVCLFKIKIVELRKIITIIFD